MAKNYYKEFLEYFFEIHVPLFAFYCNFKLQLKWYFKNARPEIRYLIFKKKFFILCLEKKIP